MKLGTPVRLTVGACVLFRLDDLVQDRVRVRVEDRVWAHILGRMRYHVEELVCSTLARKCKELT